MKPSVFDKFNQPKENTVGGMGLVHHERNPFQISGEIFVTLKHNDGTVEQKHWKNIITNVASVLLARLMKDNAEPAHGAYALAVGLGGVGWDPQNPPPAAASQTQLNNELTRKTFQSVNFISGGSISPTPTNIIDLTTFFNESEAVGALVEMGLVGGDSTLSANTGTLINYRTFPVINKPNTATLSIVWRLTF